MTSGNSDSTGKLPSNDEMSSNLDSVVTPVFKTSDEFLGPAEMGLFDRDLKAALALTN